MRTMEEIYQELARDYETAAGMALVAGGDMALRLWAVAAELFSLESQAAFLERQCFPQTAIGEYLDRHAQMRGLSRGGAVRATGSLRFTVAAAATTAIHVPAGTECMTAAGTAFVTLHEAVIPAGETDCTVTAEAVEAGAGGNVPARAIVYIKLSPAGVTAVVNELAFSGGSGQETDEELRSRVIASYQRLSNGANAAWYESRVREIPGVAAVVVQPRARGIGTVDIITSAEGGLPSQELLDQVQAMLRNEREICVDVEVKAPEAVAVNVAAALTLAEDHDFETVRAQAEQAIRGEFDGRNLGRNLYRAKLGAVLMGIEGVENYVLTAPPADVSVSEGQLPVLGSLSLSEAV